MINFEFPDFTKFQNICASYQHELQHVLNIMQKDMRAIKRTTEAYHIAALAQDIAKHAGRITITKKDIEIAKANLQLANEELSMDLRENSASLSAAFKIPDWDRVSLLLKVGSTALDVAKILSKSIKGYSKPDRLLKILDTAGYKSSQILNTEVRVRAAALKVFKQLTAGEGNEKLSPKPRRDKQSKKFVSAAKNQLKNGETGLYVRTKKKNSKEVKKELDP